MLVAGSVGRGGSPKQERHRLGVNVKGAVFEARTRYDARRETEEKSSRTND